MVPYRNSCRFTPALSLLTSRSTKTSFLTSASLRVRQKPGRRSAVRKFTKSVNWETLEEGRKTPATLRVAPSSTPARRVESKPISATSSQERDSAAETVPQASIGKPKGPKRASLRGLKSHQQSLYQHESICYQPGENLPKQTWKDDKQPLSVAASFFEQGCKLLYSASSLYNHARNDHIPEIVVLGASNAGKSSFLNALVGDMGAARVSQRPGRTQTMNAYGVGPRPKIPRELIRKGDPPPKHSLVLVDTPGYGFKSRSEWGNTILKYLDVRSMLRGAILLLPADKKLQDMDIWMLTKLAESNTRTLIVLTKADKNGEAWIDACHKLVSTIRGEMQGIAAKAPNSWWEDCGRATSIYATAAKKGITAKLGNGGGLGGVRSAALEMAGFSLKERIEKRPETATYTGAVISFGDIKWKKD
ncbi:Fc.00g113720.m01.CDS01 [Cosmosporella sp. VM-42]